MKVIFIKDVKGKGNAGDIKEVSDGYAKNYLIKNNLAVPVTNTSMNRLNEEKKAKAKKEEEEIKKNEKIKKELENKTLIFKVKTSDQNKIFGSISSKQISSELSKLGYEIDKKNIVLESPLSNLGTHIVKVNLHKKVVLNLKIELIKE
ncbi:MAG TPA: 50S ribosomal protein L9 [Mollicutes bacterium]|nr:50S ribosomal protein L9 [Mollicutes bacterium]